MNINLLEECKDAKKIGISGHIRPDGDCIGSCLALKQYLKTNLPGAEIIVNLQPMPTIFSELVGYDEVVTDFPEDSVPYDVYFALDCNEERLGDAGKYYRSAQKTINIDHHISNTGCGQINVLDPQISSTGELLVSLMEKEKMDAETAKALYVAMIHDCGVFQYSNTSPETLRRAADLIEYGFAFPEIIQHTFYEKTYAQSQILGRCLMESIRFMDGKCIVGVVDRKTADFYQVLPKHYEGIVNQLLNIRGVECAIFMYETEPMEFKVSLRASAKVDVAKVASFFGGGGHVRAAGCSLKGTFHDCVNNLSEQIEKQLV